MSLKQSRAERSDSSQYRTSGRSGSSAQPRNLSSGSRKGGGTAPPPSSSSVNSTLTSNRSVSLKKSNNAQGGQPRVGAVSGNLDAHNASAARTLQNGSQLQPPVQADAPEPAKPTTDTATQRSTQPIPNVPSSQTAANTSDTTPATPAKGDASRPFALQFGSISPGLMQIPARTNSAPPNLDEQKRDQARHGSSRAVSTFPVPAAPKHQMPRRDGGAGEQSGSGEAHQISKPRRDVQVSAAPPVTQTQKGPFLSMPGVSMPMPFHQPQIPVQFGGPNPQIQSQGVTFDSVPLPMKNPPQLQQQIFVPALQPHPTQPQVMMHQNQGLNFTSQMGPQLPFQLGNMRISISSQFTQQQTGKLGPSRKPVKITHPDTHEELRLERRADTFVDSGSSGPRTHPNVPQPQSITSVPPHHPVGSKDKPLPELSKSKSNGSRGKKKRKETLRKAYAARTTSYLFMACQASDDLVANKLDISTPLVPNATNVKSSSSGSNLSTSPDVKPSASDQSLYGSYNFGSSEGVSKPPLKHEGKGSEDIHTDFVSLPSAGSKYKPVPELSRSKRYGSQGKKKRKEILRKADAARTTSDPDIIC